MGWNVKASNSEGGDYERAPTGNHKARLVAIIDMGQQWQQYQNEPGHWANRAYFVWELVTKKKSDGTNHTIALDLTVSMNKNAKLRKFICARICREIGHGEDYNITDELDQPCRLSVGQTEGGYPKVTNVTAYDEDDGECPPSTYPLTVIRLDEFRNGTEPPEWVPYFFGHPIADAIHDCKEIAGDKAQSGPASSQPTANSQPPAELLVNWPGQIGKPYTQSLAEIQNKVEEQGIDPAAVLACKPDEDVWMPLSKFGIEEKTPF